MAALTKTNVSVIRADLNAALAAVAKKHGVDFTLGTIRFSAESMAVKLTGAVRGAGATAPADVKTQALGKMGKFLLGDKFDEKSKYHSMSLGTVKIVGFNSRAPKFPFIVQTTDGKKFKVTELAAKKLVDAGAV